MTEDTVNKENENDELICPITLELFHDPVRANDGHVYERAAIIRWILEHGTSPFTRQPLQLNDLRPDDRLRNLALKKRKTSVSYNARNESVIFPYLPTINERNNPIVANQNRFNTNIRNCSNKTILFIIFISFIIPISFILGIILGLRNSNSSEFVITTTKSGALGNNSFNRTGTSFSGIYYYTTIDMSISTNGFYGFEIHGNNYRSMDGDLYTNSFDDTDISKNLLNYVYKDKNYEKTYFGNEFQSLKYVLMITTYYPYLNGSFSINITGPDRINFL